MHRSILLYLATIALAFGADSKPGDLKQAKKERPTVLEPFVVQQDTTLSFGLGLKMLRYSVTKKVAAIYVDEVQDGSDAQRQGVRPGMQIVSLDGKPVGDFDATFQKDSDLRRLLIARKEQDTIAVELDPLDGSKPKKLTLHNRAHYRVDTKETNPLKQRSAEDAVFDQPVYRK
jgi:predicted metalloprotease with PDZ domain